MQFRLKEKPLELYKAHDFCAVKNPRLTVVLVHGIASDASTFLNTLKYLEGTTSLKEVRFVAFDLLGAGKSLHSDKLKYDYRDQVTALFNSIEKLKIKTPLVLVGHSMGTLIATRYADTYKKSVKKLVLVSPPVYQPEDLGNPLFNAQMMAFKKALAVKNNKYIKDKAFDCEIEKIVLNRYNYKRLVELKTHAVLIYGDADQIIGAFNIPGALKANPKYLTAVRTVGAHGMSRDKYTKLPAILEEVLNG